MKNTLYIVIHSYNEDEVIEETAKQLKEKINKLIKNKIISNNSRIIFIDDGSKDKTWNKIEDLNLKDSLFGGVKLSKNNGHQNALLAGLISSKDKADIVISMDADLQDDINAIDRMLEEYNKGSEIVYGVRKERSTDTFFKRNTALIFYKVMSRLGVDSVYNHADYRLMSSRAISELANFREVNLFLRGIVPLLGFKTSVVKYDRNKRFAGKSKYPIKKMINFAIDGVTSFSVKPIRLVSLVGFLTTIISFGILLYILTQYFLGNTIHGWAFTAISIWMIGGIQLFSIGVIGEYIGKIYFEVKSRPRFIIEKEI